MFYKLFELFVCGAAVAIGLLILAFYVFICFWVLAANTAEDYLLGVVFVLVAFVFSCLYLVAGHFVFGWGDKR